MKHFLRTLAAVCALIAGSGALRPVQAQSDIWVSAYYAGWMQGWANNGRLPAEKIDFSALTHVVHFSVVPRTDGTLNYDGNSITLTNSQAIVAAAHAAGKKVIISVGGWASDVGFRGATSSANRSKFISNLISFVQTRGYDGIDIDWERLESSDASQYVTFINELRQAIDALSPRPLLTAAVAWQPSILAQVHTKFDQINIMSYDLSGAWPGWVTWHNAAIYDGGFRFPSSGGAVPSINGMVDNYTGNGIPASKLGVGIDFYGYVWSGGDGTPNGGATDPRQGWTTAPSVQANVPYYTIMDTYYQSQYYRWDNAAQVSYLSINSSGSANDKFISYDDEETAKKKVEYARSKGIGGVIIWELGGGYRSNMPVGQQDPLLQAVKQALGGITPPPADVTPPSVTFTAPSAGAILSGTVGLGVNATDNVGVAGVQFKVNGANLGNEDVSAPFQASWNTGLIPDGNVTLTAVARDAAGNQSTATLSVSVLNLPSADITPPTVSFTSPADGAVVSGTVSLSAGASDNVGVAGVQFSVDGSALGSEDASAPYTATWNASNASAGSHILTAVARDAAGNQATRSITVSIPATTPPPSSNTLTIFDEALQSPWINNSWSASVVFNSSEQAENGSTSIKVTTTAAWGALSLHHGNWGSSPGVNPALYQNMNLSVYAPQGGVALSIFFENDLGQSFPKVSTGSLAAGTWNRLSFPMSQLNPNGLVIHRISIQEVSGSTKTFYADNFGFGGSTSTPPADTTRPVVTISEPAIGATVSGSVNVSATASDNVGVAGVRFLLDGSELKPEDATSPYSFTWNTAETPNGQHVLSAVARDAANNESTVSVTVTVSNAVTPPTTGLVVFDDALATPWINASWSATITFGSVEQKLAGSSSIKVVQNAWGALRIHSGPWGNQVDVEGSQYERFEFSVFGGSTGASIGVYFENDLGQSFPSVRYQWVQANQWRSFSIPMATLNPAGQVIHRVVIQDLSGRQRTYYVDQVRFASGTSAQVAESAGSESLESPDATPGSFGIGQNYPNPFNPTTTISYTLPFDAHVTLEVFNMLGERVELLVDEAQRGGSHAALFDASRLSSGTYVYRLQAMPAGDANAKPLLEVRRMTLLK